MTAKKPVPTLSQMGWVLDNHPRVDFLMAHWVRSDKRQNPLLEKSVHNLQWLLKKHQGNVLRLCEAISSDLSAYFSKYFTDVDVSTLRKEVADANNDTEYHLSISISFTDGAARYSVARIISADGIQFKRFISDNNSVDAGSF